MDYSAKIKASLLLPKTDFPMRAELPKREPAFLAKWREEGDFTATHALEGFLRSGVNELEFHFTLRRSTDGMIDACRLEGDVVVLPDGRLGASPKGGTTATSATTRAKLGLPFYCGAVRYSQRFHVDDVAGKQFLLRCQGICGHGAAVRINGASCGSIRWAPDEVDVTAALRPGANLVELDVRGSAVGLTGRVDPSRLGCRVQLVARQR